MTSLLRKHERMGNYVKGYMTHALFNISIRGTSFGFHVKETPRGSPIEIRCECCNPVSCHMRFQIQSDAEYSGLTRWPSKGTPYMRQDGGDTTLERRYCLGLGVSVWTCASGHGDPHRSAPMRKDKQRTNNESGAEEPMNLYTPLDLIQTQANRVEYSTRVI